MEGQGRAASALAEGCYLACVAAETCDILVKPAESQSLIMEAKIAGLFVVLSRIVQ